MTTSRPKRWPARLKRLLERPVLNGGVFGYGLDQIVLRAEKTGENVPSEAGFEFDRVEAKVEGSAWVALETGRLQRFELADEIRAGYTRGDGEASILTRTRHATRLVLTPRDAEAIPKEWADGSERFGRR